MFQSFIVGEVEHLFEEVDPEDGLHRPVGTAVVHAVHGSKALLVNQGERLVSENLGPTSLQTLSLLRRHQELGLPEALLRVSYSEHPPLPRPGAAPTPFPHIILPLPPEDEGFLRGNQAWIKAPGLHPTTPNWDQHRCTGSAADSPTITRANTASLLSLNTGDSNR